MVDWYHNTNFQFLPHSDTLPIIYAIHGSKFLEERKQQVWSNGQILQDTDVVSGVPQGLVIGLLLFLLIIDTIDGKGEDTLNLLCFADDMLLSQPILDVKDAENMQSLIIDLNTWQENNNMLFNNSKFQVIQFGRDENLRNEYIYMSPDVHNRSSRQ